jgi:hypothetical protein
MDQFSSCVNHRSCGLAWYQISPWPAEIFYGYTVNFKELNRPQKCNILSSKNEDRITLLKLIQVLKIHNVPRSLIRKRDEITCNFRISYSFIFLFFSIPQPTWIVAMRESGIHYSLACLDQNCNWSLEYLI